MNLEGLEKPKKLDLSGFTGTENYYKGWCNVKYTDGVQYLALNGFSWFVTDVCSVVKVSSIKDEPFIAIDLKVNADSSAVATYTDGNDKTLFKQEYEYTDAKQDIKLFFTNNVLMLTREY